MSNTREYALRQVSLAYSVIEGVIAELNSDPKNEKAQYQLNESLYSLSNAIDELGGD